MPFSIERLSTCLSALDSHKNIQARRFENLAPDAFILAGRAGLEPTTYGFGDHRSTD